MHSNSNILSFHVHFETWPFYLLQLQFILFNTAAYNLHKAFISSPYIALASVSGRFIRKKNCMSLSNWSKFISPTLLFTWSMTDWIRPFCFLLNCLGVEEGAKILTLLNMFSWSTLSRKLYSFSHGRCCLCLQCLHCIEQHITVLLKLKRERSI